MIIKQAILIPVDAETLKAIDDLSKRLELNDEQILKQALRMFQMTILGHDQGKSVGCPSVE